MADMTFGVNILPDSSSVTLGDSTHIWNAPTPASNSNNNQVANTAFVQSVLENSKMFYVGTTAPNNTNLLWIDTNNGLKYYDGSAWVIVPVSYYT